MSEYMTVDVEVWGVGADPEGLWLASGHGPWRPAEPVRADSTVHGEVELCLRMNGVQLEGTLVYEVPLIHSTSWRQVDQRVVLTYVAVIQTSGFVRRTWPDAAPIGQELLAAAGKPPTHAPAEAPTVRDFDVLAHVLRHLTFLRMYDGTAARVLEGDPLWRAQLKPLKPALAGMYNQEHPLAA